jgi:hypothetical protein
MKKSLFLLFTLFSFGTLSAQNLNFKDTNGLKTLLCSHTWYRYSVNADSTFSDRIMDSIKFYKNATVNKSARPENDTLGNGGPIVIFMGTWSFAGTARAARSDTATDCISIDVKYIKDKTHWIFSSFELFDGHRMKGTKLGKRSGNTDKPFIGMGGTHSDFDCNMSDIWQPRREIKKAKKH